MAKIRYYSALSSKVMSEEFDTDTFRLRTKQADTMRYTDANGASLEIAGTGFTYSERGEVKAGTITSVTMRDEHDHILQTVTDIKPDAAKALDLYDDLKNYGPSALMFFFIGDNDHMKGSRKADIIDGDSGNDFISGGKGDDILSGSSGKDHLTGGAGHDNFFFKEGSQRDIVTDFDDAGANQDVVLITNDQWDTLEKYQSGNDVVLDFGWGDQLILEHARLKDIGKDDFHLF